MEIFKWLLLRGLLEASALQKKTVIFRLWVGGGVISLMTYTGWVCPKGVPFFRLQVYEKVGISLVEVYGRIGEICHLGR